VVKKKEGGRDYSRTADQNLVNRDTESETCMKNLGNESSLGRIRGTKLPSTLKKHTYRVVGEVGKKEKERIPCA